MTERHSGSEVLYAWPTFTYNAVKLSPSEVAKSFVAPPAFELLARADNAVLLGPRGAGKTTLLKMLQSEALEQWDDPSAELYATGVQAVGVFVGTDRLWSEQLASAGRVPSLGVAAYGLHIARSMLRAIEHRFTVSERPGLREHLRLPVEAKIQTECAAAFADCFELSGPRHDFGAVRRQLETRVLELGKIRNQARFVSVDMPTWAYIDALEAAGIYAESVNRILNEPDRRWCLLIDELELAPEQIVDDLLSRLRGNSTVLNYKLSMAPVVDQIEHFIGSQGAVRGQDVEFISLTGMTRKETTEFTTRLMESQLAATSDLVQVSPAKLLGVSAFDETDYGAENAERGFISSPTTSVYNPGGTIWNAMKRLEDVDPSFAKWLADHEMRLDDLGSLDAHRRASLLRKIRNIVLVRSHYVGLHGRRSRKTFELYSGYSSMMGLPDGNPRMAMTLIRELVNSITLVHSRPQVSVQGQSQALESVMARFWSLLTAQQGEVIDGRMVTVVELVERIGLALRRNVLEEPFSADVTMSFRIDSRLGPEWIRLVERALNAGGLVRVSVRGEDLVTDGIGGNTYRLSYLLCPRYSLPLRTGKAGDLSNLIDSSNSRARRAVDKYQPELPGLSKELFE